MLQLPESHDFFLYLNCLRKAFSDFFAIINHNAIYHRMVESSHNYNFPTAAELLEKNVRSKLRTCSYLFVFDHNFVLILDHVSKKNSA